MYFFFTDVLPHPLSHVPNSFIGLRNRIVFMKWRFSFVIMDDTSLHFVTIHALRIGVCSEFIVTLFAR